MDKKTRDNLLALIEEYRLSAFKYTQEHLSPVTKNIFNRLVYKYKYREILDKIGEQLRSTKIFNDVKSYLYLKFFQEEIIPSIFDQQLIREFFDNRMSFERRRLIPFPKDDSEKLVFHFVYTGALRESHKNNIRAWAMAHQDKRNVEIKIWYVPETTLFEYFDTGIKNKSLKDNIPQKGKDELDLTFLRKNEYQVIKNLGDFKNDFMEKIISYPDLKIKKKLKDGIENFLSSYEVDTARYELEWECIRKKQEINNFISNLKTHTRVPIKEKAISLTELDTEGEYIFKDFNPSLKKEDKNNPGKYISVEPSEAIMSFKRSFIRNFVYADPIATSNILGAVIVYKEGGVYLPMESLPKINPKIWDGIENLPNDLQPIALKTSKTLSKMIIIIIPRCSWKITML